MILSEEDGKLFFQLWIPLLGYVNQRYNRKGKKTTANPLVLNNPDIREVADKLWENVAILDDYLDENKDMPEDHRNIIRGWKRFIKGDFVLVKHLYKGSILISLEENTTYQVLGIQSSIKEMFSQFTLPVVVKTTLIPFRDVIISDGIIMTQNLSLGGKMENSFWDKYMEDKKNGKIVKVL